jgi:homoserine kinase
MLQLRRDRIAVEAPASSANVGPGFDVFAIALDSPRDKVIISAEGEQLNVSVEGIDFNRIPILVDSNTAGIVASALIKDFHLKRDINIRVIKGVPVAMGMGSSAASASAVAFGMNILFSLDLDQNALVRYASLGEVASAGKPHADNVSASLLGGFTIVRSYTPMDVIKVDPPKHLGICIASPNVSYGAKKTEQFRAVIPESIELTKLVSNVGNASAIVAALFLKDLKLFGCALNDAVVEPARSKLIPGYFDVKKAASDSGALGVTISGAGPSMVAFFDNSVSDGSEIGRSMCEAFNKAEVEASYHITKVGIGARIVEK